MELHIIRGGNKEDLYNKKYNIGVGISLGNKWFTTENIVGLVKWSLQYTRDKVIVYVADSIHAINVEVRNNISHDKALEKTNKLGDDILQKTKSQIETDFLKEDIDRIIYIKWDEIVNDYYKQKVNYLNLLYNKDGSFQQTIHSIVKNFTSQEKKNFSDTEIHRFGDYIIEELPEVLNRVEMRGIVCDASVYPFDGELTKLVEEIQRGEKFSEVKKNVMYTEPKVFLEVR